MNDTLHELHKIDLSHLPHVALVGRANVGKSSLFNRLYGKRKSVVQDEKGTTRDRVIATVQPVKISYRLIDTGGLLLDKANILYAEVTAEIQKALKQSTLVLFVCDGKQGVHPQDEMIAEALRKEKKQVIVVINKLDRHEDFCLGDEFYRFGFKHVIKLSALHGTGIMNLVDLIEELLPKVGYVENVIDFGICIAGEANVGKSTFFNALLNEERSIVSEVPGTTRDTVDETIAYKGRKLILHDTAGLRRSHSLRSPSDLFSMKRTEDAIQSSDIVIFLFNATEQLSRLSKKILQLIVDSRKACVLTANKWDLVKGVEQGRYVQYLYEQMPQISAYPVVFMSALKRKAVLKPVDAALDVYENYRKRLKTNELNEFLLEIKKNKAIKAGNRLSYLTQVEVKPPLFLLFVKRKELLPTQSISFIRNQIYKRFKLYGTPINVILKEART